MLEEFKLKKQQKNNNSQEISMRNLTKPENKIDEECEKFDNLQIAHYKSNEHQHKNEQSTERSDININNFSNQEVFLFFIIFFNEFFF